jgi:hypothetical protein
MARGVWCRRTRRSCPVCHAEGAQPSALPLTCPVAALPRKFGTANHRAFAALDPCRQDGTSCETGIDCCSGFCTNGVCGPPQQCANLDEACKTTNDCCNDADECLGGFCGVVILR